MKKQQIIFWITTSIIFLTQSIGELVASLSGTATAGIESLGYPSYVIYFLVIAKLLGGLALMLPFISPRIKEWAYAGFTFDFILAFFSMLIVGGATGALLIPIVALIILILSYRSYHKIKALKATNQM